MSIKNYLSLVKFSHTVFAMPFALIGYFLAVSQPQYSFNWKTFGLVILAMVFARNAAMAFNRYIDRDIDSANPRTATVREIPKGVIKPKNALFFVILNVVFFFIVTYFINTLCFYLSPIAILVVLGYSYTKRFTPLCHLVLGAGLALAPIGAYLAVTAKFDWLPLFYSFAVFFWVSGFDIIYALQDEEFDKQYKLKSIPVLLGKKNALRLSEMLHIFTAFFIFLGGYSGKFTFWYWIGAIIFIALLIYQHLVVKPNDLSKVNIAFFTTNGIASVVFAVFVLLDLLL
jgi:4-hydroxybenzoate polyprenyltransferase